MPKKLLPPRNGEVLPNGTTAVVNTLPEGCEVIRQRLLDLVEITIASMQQQKMPMQQKLMMQAATPILLMGIQKEEITKLHSLVRCFNGIFKAVNDLDSSQSQYEMTVEPYITELATLLA